MDTRTIIGVSSLAFVGFLAWLWYSPHAAPVQQVQVVSGCCCGQASSGPSGPAITSWPAGAGTHATDSPAGVPVELGRVGEALPTPGVPRFAASPGSSKARSLFQAAPDALQWAPIDAPVYVTPPPRVAVAEPPAWPLWVAGLAGVLVALWAMRKREGEK